jgi:hypothetical protein
MDKAAYSELRLMLQRIVEWHVIPAGVDSYGYPMVAVRSSLIDEARALLARMGGEA